MSQIIASTYELLQQIGAGGGGVVYLGRHLRLGKLIVLKADKRTIATKPEVLRREVDALKNLSHTYIPQVYDFVVENGVVYTVMDFIEGESLDKPLKRGERFPQSQVIEWACQLLEALAYLHSRQPHGILHGDIKPANIMRTPENEIRLIDFNIALALGEEGAVQVGFSRGYASPEHYGVEYSATSATQGVAEDVVTSLDTEPLETVVTSNVSSGSGRQHMILLDVRSDIYSLGATLYHLLTGHRPPQDAKAVEKISDPEVSPAVADIIQKAMAPDPNQRWQTAAEMLCAFEHLHTEDPRARRHKRRCRVTAALLSCAFLAGGALSFVGLKQMERTQNAYALAEYSAQALRKGDVSGAVSYALEALPTKQSIFNPPQTPQAQRALANALGVYDLTDGFKAHRLLELPGAPIKTALSPGGTRTAALTSGLVTVFDTESGTKLAELPAESSAMADLVFVDENTLLYAGKEGLQCYDLAGGQVQWSGAAATGIALSGDGGTVCAVYRDENTATVYDVATGETVRSVSFQNRHQKVLPNDVFADPEDNLLALDGTGRWLAVSFSDGALRIFDLKNSENDIEIYDGSDYSHFEGGFFQQYFAFSATKADESVFAVIDLNAMEQTGGFLSEHPFRVQTDDSGVYLSTENILVQIDPVTGEQRELAYPDADITAFARTDVHTLTATANDAFSVFDSEARLLQSAANGPWDFVGLAGDFVLLANRDMPSLRLLKLDAYPEAQLCAYSPAFLHDEARVSSNKTTVMLYRYDCFRLLDSSGNLLSEMELPDAGEVYDQQYRRTEDGCYLEVFYNDGTIRRYSAESGALLSEAAGEKPDGTLDEEFLTDRFRIEAPLHGTPIVYDRESGEKIRELEDEDYLTYVTQVGDSLITQYVSTQGQRYGLLLDQNLEVIADMPNLCDILPDGTLIFDDMRGNLRQSRIYSIQELLASVEN